MNIMMHKMTRKIGDKLTDKNGVRVKIVEEQDDYDTCLGCFYNTSIFTKSCDPVRTDNKQFFSEVHDGIGCFNGGFIFVEDK